MTDLYTKCSFFYIENNKSIYNVRPDVCLELKKGFGLIANVR